MHASRQSSCISTWLTRIPDLSWVSKRVTFSPSLRRIFTFDLNRAGKILIIFAVKISRREREREREKRVVWYLVWDRREFAFISPPASSIKLQVDTFRSSSYFSLSDSVSQSSDTCNYVSQLRLFFSLHCAFLVFFSFVELIRGRKIKLSRYSICAKHRDLK